MMEALRNGSWLTGDRLRVYPMMLLAGLALAFGYLIATKTGMMDQFDRPLGTDFSQVWAAGQEVLQGHPAMPYDNSAHAQMQRDIFGEKTQFYGWHYPPFFLALAALLATMPYLPALLAWQGVTLAMYLIAIGAIMQPQRAAQWLIPALAFPAVFVNLGHGHNGFLTAALLAGALLVINKKPLLAGILLGLLAYKPQFAIILPVALVAGGYWRSMWSAATTVACMTLLTLAAFGPEVWQGFFHSLAFTREVVLEQGSTGFEKIQTVFAAIRLMGGGIGLAYGVQTLCTLSCVAAIAWLWRSRVDFDLKAAALMTSTLLTTPYALDYDMMVLGPAIALMVGQGLRKGFAPYEKSMLALVWLVPLLARGIGGAVHVPLGVFMVCAFLRMVLHRAWKNPHMERQITLAPA